MRACLAFGSIDEFYPLIPTAEQKRFYYYIQKYYDQEFYRT
jgi:hypothetical protein